MEITKELIERFLNGQCTATEAAFVSAWFEENPKARNEYLQDSWRDEPGAGGSLPGGYEEEMWQAIRRRIFQMPALPVFRRRHRLPLPALVAASVILALTGIWLYKLLNEKPPLVLPAGPLAAQVARPAEAWQWKENHTDQKLKIKLEDGSVVSLLPESRIRFVKSFASAANRNIYLEGQAFFEVAKDKAKPFTVYAGNVATTVLGTFFSVRESRTGILVKLYSGKVRVHAARSFSTVIQNDVLLKPGEQFRFEAATGMAKVSSFRTAVKNAEYPVFTEDDQGMVFDRAPLSEVMERLSKHYQIPVLYNKTTLSDMFFSGSVLKTDSLPNVLRIIANMNGLQVLLTNEGYMLHSSKN